jgi:sigma-E factor negative regulatory protein RseA
MNERLSAWMDGELEARELPSQVKSNAALRSAWDCYHLIGDTLRGEQGSDLCARICARLDAEPTVLAPQRRSAAEILRWRPLRVAASITAVAFVGWMALFGLKQDTPQIAAIPAPEVKQAAMPDVNGYLLAHQLYSPSGVMQGVAPYVRTVEKVRSPEFCPPLAARCRLGR